ncbi:roadblock/LC7 domain-containing protein [Oceanithermus sp.]
MSWLRELEAIPSVKRAVLTGLDGLVIEEVGQGGVEAQFLAAEMASLQRAMEPLTRALGEELRRYTLATDEYELLAVCFADYCLGALIDRAGGQRALVGQTLSRLAATLVERL